MKVGLYIPCYNAAKTIGCCLDGIMRQVYPIEEVLVIDDASTDRSVEIISKYPVKLIRFDSNRGLAAVRNAAVNNLSTEFIASLDADCSADADWLGYLMENFKSADTAGVGGRLLELNCSNIPDLWRSVHMKQFWPVKVDSPPFLFGSNTVLKKEAILSVGFYNEIYRNNYEDVDMCQRLKKAGYFLVYEDKAIARHLKSDTLESVMNTYWRWNLEYYKKESHYDDLASLIFKIKDNIGLANRYIEEDINSKKYKLIYLDFILALHHSLKDFEYFSYKGTSKEAYISGYSSISRWLALLDLTLFYHLGSNKKNLATIFPGKEAFLQNFFALNLILGKFIRKEFKNSNFQKMLYRHLFIAVYRINDELLLDRLLNLSILHKDWSALFIKEQPNLNSAFLDILFFEFKKWIMDFKKNFPDIIDLIEFSGANLDEECGFVSEEVCENEAKNK